MIEIPEPLKPVITFAHPVLMWILFALTLYAMYLGIQTRRLRSLSGEEKKALIQAKVNVKHHQVGAILLALMVMGTIGGMAVTYINNGKLFVGPHLIVGLTMTALIALSASLVPFMQKGSETARALHMTLNLFLVILFGWQAVTGLQIVQRILNAS
ncbi:MULTISPECIES: DUF4079 domain-containing protein [unclassified Thermosynechococcus]|uniref:DUF4079 domain-containing protein n=1 Tax=unclassified Thermosynechococcus TaxID=2622553 RepID=UPI001981E99A|nr:MULTISPECIES: DUF4079 domain-containing protein [unclassified Thermosynechococcus]MDR5640112.1 DUF4079 domain-containing protein [Thermosynechococcus sp. PP42]MDR7897459.1 DUF4079 domain-containing protein [Thermosynechococcus sp. JY1332]MDR7904864.1 DUF4079 domain-containing protein [Thermosynechococcus sp. JY1334]MDR7922417.1 DUF4079 domain-containing protein [Thermosynechococcus sp. HY213]MDR7992690.1 DUF4079 domain-containing protein [Thermosynechococcus sp. TG252]